VPLLRSADLGVTNWLEAEMTTVDIDKLEARLREADSWHGLPPEAFDLLREVRELRGIAEAARKANFGMSDIDLAEIKTRLARYDAGGTK
jgi:hypothetical protein